MAILIHSRPSDQTTVDIIQWLCCSGKSFFRLNNLSDLPILQLSLQENRFQSAYYNGRGFLYHRISTKDQNFEFQLHEYLGREMKLVLNHILSKSDIKRVFGNPPYGQGPEKLHQLDVARKLGLSTPNFEIVSTKERMKQLKNDWGRIICKAFGDGVSIVTSNFLLHGQKTQEIHTDTIDGLNEFFYPTYVQRLVQKQFEVRTFCFRKIIRSIAIFTQSNNESQIDGRVSDHNRLQRQVPFQLPSLLESKMRQMLNVLGLEYGSFDFIVTPKDEFVFLEVNPYGQYGFVSQAGNYYIEKDIAQYL
jgi:hypothetical protein